ncbi:hypothetical protein [Mameliella sp. MMSF_3455]|uniref:hypothetical protein n=1 Tax=Mameliella sp. MMSF_3455 TaxID=3046714 RepID=UPI00273DD33C|nr:hypothetical protein [Mameliella sp. MMSF_3455]
MLYWIRIFLVLSRVSVLLLAVTLMPSNVSAMVQCDGHEAPIAQALDQADQTTKHAVDHVTDHCGSHICVLGDLRTADAETPRSVGVATRSWDMASLVVTAIPEGLQRPPRA